MKDTDKEKITIIPFFTNQKQERIAIAYNSERYLSKIASDFIDMTVREFNS